jgi:hypothetical protein
MSTKQALRDAEDEKTLAALGYKQEFTRAFSMIETMAFAFSISKLT